MTEIKRGATCSDFVPDIKNIECSPVNSMIKGEILFDGQKLLIDGVLFGEVIEVTSKTQPNTYRIRRISENKYLNGQMVDLQINSSLCQY